MEFWTVICQSKAILGQLIKNEGFKSISGQNHCPNRISLSINQLNKVKKYAPHPLNHLFTITVFFDLPTPCSTVTWKRRCKNWIDPFEGIETINCFPGDFIHFKRKNWIDPFEGIETLLGRVVPILILHLGKNWIDPFEGIETFSVALERDNWDLSKNWIDPFEGIETLFFLLLLFQHRRVVRIELTRLRGLRLILLFLFKLKPLTSKNWIDPFEGIET